MGLALVGGWHEGLPQWRWFRFAVILTGAMLLGVIALVDGL